MNRIRSELKLWIPQVQKNITRKEISNLLLFRENATLKEIASYLSIDISDDRDNDPRRDATPIYAIDIETRDVVQEFESITSTYKTLLIRRGGRLNYNFRNIIESQFAFNLNGRYVILSFTPHIEGEINPIFVHSMNLPRFRKFLYDLGYDFVNWNTSTNDIRKYFGFPRDMNLKTIMEHFHFPWCKIITGGYNEKVLIRIVTPTSVSNGMGMREIGIELDIGHNCVRDYISRGVFFRYRTNRRDSFLIYA